jgi:cytochrome c oxidase subunit 2
MSVDKYERIWMWGAGGLIVAFLAVIGITAVTQAVHPPSHIETVDPTTISEHPEFGDPQMRVEPDGRIVVPVLAQMFGFWPNPIEVPVNTPITFRITSADVVHGFQVVGTNANAMAVPGYVSQFTYTFKKAGNYDIACNEYCGLMHHAMVGIITVTDTAGGQR